MHIQEMPKGHRTSRSQGYYRSSPILSTNSIPSQYVTQHTRTPSQSQMNNSYYPSPMDSMSQPQPQHYNNSSYATGGPVQHPSLQPLYTQSQTQAQQQAPLSLPTPPPVSLRPSSGAWTPHDDAQLMSARSSGMNWLPIQQAYFPTKSANACRKRHERLMERRNADDWDGAKLELLAKTYMGMRREIWQSLADITGEKWTVVEAKCMSQGLKNLQTHARSHARRERMSEAHQQIPSSHSQSHSSNTISSQSQQHNPYTNNSSAYHPTTTNELTLSVLDDLENEYDDDHDPENDGSDRSRSVGSVYGHQSVGSYISNQGVGSGGHSHTSSTGSGGSRGWQQNGLNGMNGMGGMMNVNGNGHSRLPSQSDNMGIESIINRSSSSR